MPANSHIILLDEKHSTFILKGLHTVTIKEPAVPVFVNGHGVGSFQGLEVFERTKGTNGFPQTIADLVSNGYFRLTYQKPRGNSATFGTSIIGAPSFRPRNERLRLIPTVARAEVITGGPQRLKVSLIGFYGNLAEIISMRTYATEAENFHTSMKAEITFSATSEIELEPSSLGHDSFRLFTISSMYSSATRYDGSLLTWGTKESISKVALRENNGRGKYFIESPALASQISVIKELGSTGASHTPGSPDSPSIQASIVRSSFAPEEIGARAYWDGSSKLDDDSLSMWFEWIKAPPIIKKGTQLSWVATFSAFPPSQKTF